MSEFDEIMFGLDESFNQGKLKAKEDFIKILKDTRNKYNSWLSNEQIPKLGKTANFERTVSYKAYIEIIDELLNKIK